MAALVDTLGVSRPVVLGTSFGGFVVQHYPVDVAGPHTRFLGTAV